MKFSVTAVSAAIIAIGGTSVKVQVQAKNQSPSSKSTKSDGDVGEDSLKEYSSTKPANFEGVYHSCWLTIIRNSATGIGPGTYHLCYDEYTPEWAKERGFLTITKTDAYNAYQSVSRVSPIEELQKGSIRGIYQGVAKGDTISFTSYGIGAYQFDEVTGVIDLSSQPTDYNDTPDTKICQKSKGGILECTSTLVEYCSPFSLTDYTAPFCQDRVGQWLNSYTLSSVMATDIANCPAPPPDYCESENHRLPETNPLDFNNQGQGGSSFGEGVRHLIKDDEHDGDGSRHPCPVLAGMYA